MKNNVLLFLFFSFIISVQAKEYAPFGRILSGTKESPRIVACDYPELAFLLPEMAGNFKLGIIFGSQSAWLNNPKNIKFTTTKEGVGYEVNDPLLGKGKLNIRIHMLTDTDGLIIEVEAVSIPAGVDLFWSFGGAYGKVITGLPTLEPQYCKYNVFSVEGNAFTVYYAESMALKVFQGVVPETSEIRLSDAHQQSSPLSFFQSGKKTDAPALTASFPLQSSQKYYFCFYRQNAKADYNYFMLPGLFKN